MYRRILPSALLSMLFLSGCATQQKTAAHRKSKHSCETAVGSIQNVRTTAYTGSEPGGGHSACGTRLCGTNSKGKVKSAASDWSRFPLGTKFEIVKTREVYEICDYGSALVGKETIDLYKSSRHEMRNWGMRHVDIKILRWGSPTKSLKVLAPRGHSHHVHAMLADLREQT
ncbi:MAG: 3D domain-containing protein [Chthoniobacteraceae bacterium]